MNFRTKVLVTASLLILVFSLYSCASREEKRDSFLKKGIRLYEAGEYKKAVLEFKNVLQLDPDFAPGYFHLGKAYFKQGNIKKAKGSLSKALSLGGEMDEARLGLGMILVMAKEGEKALKTIKPLLDKDPAHARALLISAQAYLALKKPNKAIEGLEKIDQAKRDNEVLFAFAGAYNLMGDTEKVKEYLCQYQKAAPDNPTSYLVLSRIYAKERQLEKAEDQVRKLIEQKEADPSYLLLLCKFFVDTGQEKKAGAEFDRLIKENPQENSYKLAYAEYLFKQKRLDQCRALLTEAVRSAPDSWKLRDYLVKVYLAQRKVDDALKELNDFLQRNVKGDKIEALLKKGQIMAGLDRWAEAMQQCDLALAVESTNPNAHLLKGKVLFQKGSFDDAIIHLRQVVDSKPFEPEGHLFLARALAVSVDIPLAIEQLKQGLKNLPQDTALRMELISYYVREREWENALEYAYKALNKAPDNPQVVDTVAWVEFKSGNLDKAIKYADSAVKGAEKDPMINYHAGLINARIGKNAVASEYLSKAVELGLKEEYAKEAERILKTLK